MHMVNLYILYFSNQMHVLLDNFQIPLAASQLELHTVYCPE